MCDVAIPSQSPQTEAWTDAVFCARVNKHAGNVALAVEPRGRFDRIVVHKPKLREGPEHMTVFRNRQSFMYVILDKRVAWESVEATPMGNNENGSLDADGGQGGYPPVRVTL